MSWWHKYMDMTFVEKGRTMEEGDCWNMPIQVYKNELNIDLPSYIEVYESTNDREILAKTIKRESENHWEIVNSPKEFDVIILDMRGLPMHVGIVTKPNHMIHCAKGINTVHENYTTMRWKHKVKGFARWKP